MTAGLELSLTALKLIVMGMTLYLHRSVRVLSDVRLGSFAFDMGWVVGASGSGVKPGEHIFRLPVVDGCQGSVVRSVQAGVQTAFRREFGQDQLSRFVSQIEGQVAFVVRDDFGVAGSAQGRFRQPLGSCDCLGAGLTAFRSLGEPFQGFLRHFRCLVHPYHFLRVVRLRAGAGPVAPRVGRCRRKCLSRLL